MCLCIGFCTWMWVPLEFRERVSDSLELELQSAVSYLIWVLETEPRALQEQCPLYHRAIFPGPHIQILNIKFLIIQFIYWYLHIYFKCSYGLMINKNKVITWFFFLGYFAILGKCLNQTNLESFFSHQNFSNF